MVRSGADLVEFSNAQVNDGLNYIFSEACFRHADNFGDSSVWLDLKLAAIRAIKHLYEDCFEPRCDSRLGHPGEGSENPLNYMAYMLWDVTPIPKLNRQVPDAIGACVEVMEFALHSSNDACIEGAVHGLGHLRPICWSWPNRSLIGFLPRRWISTRSHKTARCPVCVRSAGNSGTMRAKPVMVTGGYRM